MALVYIGYQEMQNNKVITQYVQHEKAPISNSYQSF
jgi:hypothetical protein